MSQQQPPFAPLAIVAGIVIAALLIVSVSMFHIVEPGTRGVSVIFGEVNKQFKPEGLNIKWPIAETIYNVPIKQVTVSGSAPSFSSDLQTVNIKFDVLFRIPEGKVVELFRDYSGNAYNSLVEPRVQEAIKQVTAEYRAEDLVKNRRTIKAKALESLRADLKGLLTISDLVINNIDLTDDLKKAIEQKTVREQEALAKKFELDKALKDKEITIVKAEAEAESVRIKGEALRSSPEVIQLEIAKKWDGKAPASVVVGKGGANVLLPLK